MRSEYRSDTRCRVRDLAQLIIIMHRTEEEMGLTLEWISIEAGTVHSGSCSKVGNGHVVDVVGL